MHRTFDPNRPTSTMTAQPDKPEPTSNKTAVAPTDQLVSTQHKARINGETIHYTVTCGTVVLKEDGETD